MVRRTVLLLAVLVLAPAWAVGAANDPAGDRIALDFRRPTADGDHASYSFVLRVARPGSDRAVRCAARSRIEFVIPADAGDVTFDRHPRPEAGGNVCRGSGRPQVSSRRAGPGQPPEVTALALYERAGRGRRAARLRLSLDAVSSGPGLSCTDAGWTGQVLSCSVDAGGR